MPITVSIVEDDPGLRVWIEDVVRKSEQMSFLKAYHNGEEAVFEVVRERPRVLLVDIRLGDHGMSGIELVRRIRPSTDGTDILMFTIVQNPTKIFEALEAGANGYLLKRDNPVELIEAILEAVRGGAPMSSEVARLVVQSFSKAGATHPQNALSVREHEVLDLLARGFSYKEIGRHLCLSYHTIHTHVKNIYGKLHARTRFEALRNAGKLPR